MSQPVLEPRAGRCVGFGEWATGGTQVTSVLAVHGVGFNVGPSNISSATQGSVPMSGQPSADREGNWRAQFEAMSMDFLIVCFGVHSGLSIRWP